MKINHTPLNGRPYSHIPPSNVSQNGHNKPVVDLKVREAFLQAEHDIEQDPDFKPHPTHDLDEGEVARYGE